MDFLCSFIDDPPVFGQLAANHALSDIFAMGAQAQSASAIATLPAGREAKNEELSFQLLCGALHVLDAADCILVGAHRGKGRELALGLAVHGLIEASGPTLRKDGLRPEDGLVLTKPLGTGTVLAAPCPGIRRRR